MTEACRIRDVREDDLPMILAWRNHPQVRSSMLTQHEIGLEEHLAWFAQASADAKRRLFIVEDGGSPIGYVHFSNGEAGAISDWGFYAKPDASRGTGQKMGWAALNHAFAVLALHKVCGQAFEVNKASIALHRKLGFQQEGFLRDQHRIDGVFCSLLCFGLLRRDWRAGQ